VRDGNPWRVESRFFNLPTISCSPFYLGLRGELVPLGPQLGQGIRRERTGIISSVNLCEK